MNFRGRASRSDRNRARNKSELAQLLFYVTPERQSTPTFYNGWRSTTVASQAKTVRTSG